MSGLFFKPLVCSCDSAKGSSLCTCSRVVCAQQTIVHDERCSQVGCPQRQAVHAAARAPVPETGLAIQHHARKKSIHSARSILRQRRQGARQCEGVSKHEAAVFRPRESPSSVQSGQGTAGTRRCPPGALDALGISDNVEAVLQGLPLKLANEKGFVSYEKQKGQGKARSLSPCSTATIPGWAPSLRRGPHPGPSLSATEFPSWRVSPSGPTSGLWSCSSNVAFPGGQLGNLACAPGRQNHAPTVPRQQRGCRHEAWALSAACRCSCPGSGDQLWL